MGAAASGGADSRLPAKGSWSRARCGLRRWNAMRLNCRQRGHSRAPPAKPQPLPTVKFQRPKPKPWTRRPRAEPKNDT
eukprot:7250586-Alexandrium_andersonii.AAC.1